MASHFGVVFMNNFTNGRLREHLQSRKVVLILANSAELDEMQHHAAFHPGLHCLPKYPFRGFIQPAQPR